MSFYPGDTLKFYISTPVSPFYISIQRTDTALQVMTVIRDIPGKVQAVPDSSYWYGCRWDESYRFVIPEDWPSGVYRAKFPVENGLIKNIIFVVKQKLPAPHSRILYMLNTNTWNAYNNFGGKSLYKGPSAKVSFQRPSDTMRGYPDFVDCEELFIKWAYRNGFKMDYVVNYDVHTNPDLLSNYDLVITSGHSEYWSRPERLQFEQYLSRGGKVIFLSGNNVWWQIRYEDEGSKLVSYKTLRDPLRGIIDSLVTVNWKNEPLNYPENSFTGTSFAGGGYVNRNAFFAADGFADYAAFNTHHWVFNGTGLKEGNEFGLESEIVGYEADGADFIWVDGIPKLTGKDKSPENFRVLGLSPALNVDKTTKYGMMGIYYLKGGGALFNAGTMNWDYGLVNDTIVQRITFNVIDQFLSNGLPPEITYWQPAVVRNAVINKQNAFINSREIDAAAGSINLSVKAESPDQQVTYLWKVNNNIISTDSVMKLDVDNFTPVYNVTAYAITLTDTSSISWVINNTSAVKPAAPVLISPPDKSGDQPVAAKLSWNYMGPGTTYHVQLSTDSLFNYVLHEDTATADTTCSLALLNPGINYYWRVKCSYTGGETSWSDLWSFTTIAAEDTAVLNKIEINVMDGSLSGEAVIDTIAGTLNTHAVYFADTSGRASFNIDIPESQRDWYIWGRMFYNGSQSLDSFSVIVNSSIFKLGDGDTKYDTWHWNGYNGTKVNIGKLPGGLQGLVISAKESGIHFWIDQIIITDDPDFLPEGFVPGDENNLIPEPVQVISPVDSSISQPLSTSFTWLKSSGAAFYVFQLASDSNFTSLAAYDSSITDTFKVQQNLLYNTKYYWRVKAKNTYAESDWTHSRVFTTILNPDTAPRTKILVNANGGVRSGGARLGSMTGMVNSNVIYFVNTSGGVSFSVNIPESPGDWFIWGRMYYKSSGGLNSFYVSANGNKLILGDDNTKYNKWHWDGYNGTKVNIGKMNAGPKTITISGREPGTTLWIDQVIITDDPDFLPEGFVLKSETSTPPPVVQLQSPADLSVNQSLKPVFRWLRSEGPSSYILHVSKDFNFNTIAAYDSALADTFKVLSSNLSYSTKYYWRVKSKNSISGSNWSTAWSFTTVSSPDTLPKTKILVNANSGARSGGARLGSMTGMINKNAVYFVNTTGGVSFNITVPESPREWYIWGRMYYKSSGSLNSFFVTANDKKLTLGDDDTKYNTWHWDGYKGNKLNIGKMSAGQKSITISGREPGTSLWIDQIIITDDSTYNPNAAAKENTFNDNTIAAVPDDFELFQNFPNPFNPVTVIRYSVPATSFIELKVFDILGTEVETIVNEIKTPGIYEVKFDANEYSSGVYIYQFRGNGFVLNKKMNLIK